MRIEEEKEGSGEMLVSEVTKSIAMGDLMGCPHEDQAPLTAWMEERRRCSSVGRYGIPYL